MSWAQWKQQSHAWFCLILTLAWELLTLPSSHDPKAPADAHSLPTSVFSSHSAYLSIKGCMWHCTPFCTFLPK